MAMKDWIDKAQAQAEAELETPPQAGAQDLEENVVSALKGVYDPEIPVNIYDLGLIYNVDIDQNNHAFVKMTLTSPGCPVAQTFPGIVECAVQDVQGISECCVELVWDPPWSPDRMSDAAKLELNML